MTLHRANVFSSASPVSPASYYVPGNEAPAVSTADYYHIDGPYWFRPYDLNTWGSPGQAIAASRGRYWWVGSSDHGPSDMPWQWRDGCNFMAGYSDDPGVLPGALTTLIPWNDRPTGIDPDTGTTFLTYEAPWCLYNPDDTDGLPFYLYAESAGGIYSHTNILWRSDDLLVWTPMQGSHVATSAGWGSFQRVFRLGTGNWISLGHGGETSYLGPIKWTSTDGQTFTSTETPLKYYINGGSTYTEADSPPASAGTSQFGISATEYVTISGQLYALASERTEANKSTNQFATTPFYVSLVPVDSSFNVLASPAVIRLSGVYDGVFPGPGWLQDVNGYQEDGVLHVYAFHGYPSQVNTFAVSNAFVGVPYIPTTNICEFTGSISGTTLTVTSVEYGSIPYTYDYEITGTGISGSCGVHATITGAGFAGTYTVTSSQIVAPGTAMVMTNPYQDEGQAGGLVEKFCDYFTYIYDAAAAAAAAPVGVTASCAAGTVTISWYDALPNDTYRVKRYTSASNAASNTSPTTVGDVTGESTTDTPAPGQQYWYRVSTLESGTERGYRIVRAYCSSASAFVNKHIDRVIQDGGEESTIDTARLTAIDDWLDDNGFKNSLLHWVDARFGVKKDGGNVVEKVYDLGTTWLPRGGDLTTVGSSTTYSATAMASSIPGWINGTSTARAYFGGGTRFNQIRRKNQLTVAVLYERGTTAADCTFLGTSTSSGGLGGHQNGSAYNGTTAGISLVHEAGTPGTIKFNVQDNTGGTSTKVTASVAADSATLLTAIGSYDGTSMIAYSNGTAGSADTSLNPNPYFMDDTALAGARGTVANIPVLASGSKDAHYAATDGSLPFAAGTFTFGQSNALFTAGALVVLGKGLTAPQAASLNALLQGNPTAPTAVMPLRFRLHT